MTYWILCKLLIYSTKETGGHHIARLNPKTKACKIVILLTLQPCSHQLVSVSFQYLQLAAIDVIYTDAFEDVTPADTMGLTRR